MSTPRRNRIPAIAQWCVINGKNSYYRSKLELGYARHLETLKARGAIKDFEHEPRCFWFLSIKRGIRSYLPDFRVDNLDDTHHYVEVKGYMDSKSATKIKRFRKYYPEEKLIVFMKP